MGGVLAQVVPTLQILLPTGSSARAPRPVAAAAGEGAAPRGLTNLRLSLDAHHSQVGQSWRRGPGGWWRLSRHVAPLGSSPCVPGTSGQVREGLRVCLLPPVLSRALRLQAAAPPSASSPLPPRPLGLSWAHRSPGARKATPGAANQSQLPHSLRGFPWGWAPPALKGTAQGFFPDGKPPMFPVAVLSPVPSMALDLGSWSRFWDQEAPWGWRDAPSSHRHPEDPLSGLFGR